MKNSGRCLYYMLLLLFIILSFPENIVSQNIHEEYILQYWVFSFSESKLPVITYRLQNFNFDSNQPFFYRNAGIEFYGNQTVRSFHYRQCGNDTGPASTEGLWSIYQEGGVKKLKINFPNEESIFEILELSAEKIVLKKL